MAAVVTHQRGEASLDTDWLFHSTARTEVLRFFQDGRVRIPKPNLSDPAAFQDDL